MCRGKGGCEEAREDIGIGKGGMARKGREERVERTRKCEGKGRGQREERDGQRKRKSVWVGCETTAVEREIGESVLGCETTAVVGGVSSEWMRWRQPTDGEGGWNR